MTPCGLAPRNCRSRATSTPRCTSASATPCSATAHAMSATPWPCPRSATTTRWPRKAMAARWCARARGVELVSNVCRHRQALMLRGRGTTRTGAGHAGNIVCPLHRWTYDLQGCLIGAPHFDRRPLPEPGQLPAAGAGTACCSKPTRCNVAADLAALGTRADLDFSGYVLDRDHLHECDYNWKTFIEVYLEDYHVGPFHPGLGHFVTCDDLRWEMGARLLGADRRRRAFGQRGAGSAPDRPSTGAGTTPCCATARRRRRRTARSG